MRRALSSLLGFGLALAGAAPGARAQQQPAADALHVEFNAHGQPLARRLLTVLKAGRGAQQLLEPGATWCAPVPAHGSFETLRIQFDTPRLLDSLELVPLDARDFDQAKRHGSIAAVAIITDAGRFTAELPDFVAQAELEAQGPHVDCEPESCMPRDQRIRTGSTRFLRFGRYLLGGREFQPQPVLTSHLTLVIQRTLPGRSSSVTCASGLRLYAAAP